MGERAASPTSVIDLDVGAAPESSGRASRPRAGRPRWPFGLLLAAVLALVAGSAPVMPSARPLVLRGDGVEDIRGYGDDIYVLAAAVLRSYRMTDGARRWSVPVEAGTQLVAVDGERVVLGHDGGPDHPTASTVTGLDAATGAQVWRRTGYAPWFVSSTSALDVVIADAYPPGGGRSLAGIEIRTGVVRWSFTAPTGIVHLIEPGDTASPTQIAELDPDGTLRVRDAESAEIVRTVRLVQLGQVDGFDIAGDRLLAYRSGQGTTEDNAVFDLHTGRRLWQRQLNYGPTGRLVGWCGPMLCEQTAGSRFVVLDPGTGRERWHLDGWTDLGPLDDRYMLAFQSTPNADEPSPGDLLLLDAATGRTVRRIDGAEFVGLVAGPDVLLTSRNGAGDTVVAQLDADSGTVAVLGQAAHWHAPSRCITTATHLACWLGQIAIWPLPARPAITGRIP